MSIVVEIVRAWPRRHEAMRLELAQGATVADALTASGWRVGNGEGVAVFGVRSAPEQLLADGDRIELLRGLQADPKDARRRRAAKRQA